MQSAEKTSRAGAKAGLRVPAPALAGAVDLRRPEAACAPDPLGAPSLSLDRYVARLVAADTAAAGLSALLAIILRFSGSPGTINGVSYLALVPVFLIGWLGIMWLGGTYDRRILVSGTEEFRRVLNGGVWMLAAVAVVGFAAHIEVSRSVIAMALASATLLSLGARYGARRVIQGHLRAHATLHRAVVVGTKDEAASLVAHMQRNPHAGFAVTAVHCPPPGGLTIGERIAEILGVARQTGADTVAVAGSSGFDSSQLRRLAWGLEGTGLRFLMVPALTDLAGPRIRVHPVDGLPLLHIQQPEFTGPKLAIKRCMDLVGGTLIIVLLLPVLLAIAAAVAIASGRPILYSQIRVGRHGELFKMFKFRTMVPEADSLAEAEVDSAPSSSPVRPKPERDPRITRVGGFLRHHSLDELPQLLNVLAGTMSLVGPRPHRPFEVAEYAEDVRRRLLIKPGLTGLWQVSGRATLPWEENVRLDLRYVENWSIWLDMLLILKTLRAVAFPRGAY